MTDNSALRSNTEVLNSPKLTQAEMNQRYYLKKKSGN